METLKAIFKIGFWEGVFNNIFGAFLVLAMMVLIVSNTVGRYVLNTPIHGTIELTEFMMVGIVYFTLAYAQANKKHLRVELLYEFFPRKIQLACDLAAYMIGLIVFALISWQGVLSFLDSWEFGEATMGYVAFPIYPAKAAVPVGCFLLCLRLYIDIIDVMKEIFRRQSS